MSKGPITEKQRQQLLAARGMMSMGGQWFVRLDLVESVDKGAIEALLHPPSPEPAPDATADEPIALEEEHADARHVEHETQG